MPGIGNSFKKPSQQQQQQQQQLKKNNKKRIVESNERNCKLFYEILGTLKWFGFDEWEGIITTNQHNFINQLKRGYAREISQHADCTTCLFSS